MNIQKSIVFYISNGHKDSKIKYNTMYNHSKNMQMYANKINTGFVCIQVLFAESNKTVIKENFKDLNRERDTL